MGRNAFSGSSVAYGASSLAEVHVEEMRGLDRLLCERGQVEVAPRPLVLGAAPWDSRSIVLPGPDYYGVLSVSFNEDADLAGNACVGPLTGIAGVRRTAADRGVGYRDRARAGRSAAPALPRQRSTVRRPAADSAPISPTRSANTTEAGIGEESVGLQPFQVPGRLVSRNRPERCQSLDSHLPVRHFEYWPGLQARCGASPCR